MASEGPSDRTIASERALWKIRNEVADGAFPKIRTLYWSIVERDGARKLRIEFDLALDYEHALDLVSDMISVVTNGGSAR